MSRNNPHLPIAARTRRLRAMKTRSLILASALLVLAGISPTYAGSVSCKLKFSMAGWSAFYKRSDGSGTITCDNGQSMRVHLRARGGGPSIGKSTIKNGSGDFSGVDNIKELLGNYASAEAEAGAVKSAKAHVVTKGPISLALVGTGEGWEVGIAFGNFQITRR
jgi:hypothetical protein